MAISHRLVFDESELPDWGARVVDDQGQAPPVPEEFDLSTLVPVNVYPPGHARQFTAEELQALATEHRAVYGMSLLKAFAVRGVPEHLDPTKSYYLAADRGLVYGAAGRPAAFVLDGPAIGDVGADEEVTGDWDWDVFADLYIGGDELWLLSLP